MIAAPEYLTDLAREEWARVLATGLDVSGVGVTVLAGYCQHWARWIEAERVITAEGPEVILRDDKGNVRVIMASPQVRISAGAFDRMLRAAAALGIRPGSGVPARTGQRASRAAESHAGWFDGAVQ